MERGWVHLANNICKRVTTTKGWLFLVKWKDGTSSWVPLCELKESNPIETAEYAKSRDLLKFPAFAWWANHVLKKRDILIKKVKSRASKKKI